MNFCTTTISNPANADTNAKLMALGRIDLTLGCDLKFSVACNHCNGESPLAQNQNQAIGAALGAGWFVKVPDKFVIRGWFNVDFIDDCEIVCPRCHASEFSEIQI